MERSKSISSSAPQVTDPRLVEYLQQSLGLTASEIALAVRDPHLNITELPILLWDRGLIDLDQLDQLFDWLEETV